MPENINEDLNSRAEEFFKDNPAFVSMIDDVEPTDPVEPTNPTDPVEPTEPTEPKEVTLSSLTGGKYNSVEDIDSYIQKQLSERQEALKAELEQSRYQTDLAKRIDELATSGVEVTPDLLAEINRDYNSVDITDNRSAIDLIKKSLRLKEPGITEKELEVEIKSKFGKALSSLPNPDDVDNYEELVAQREAEQLRLTRSARQAKQELVENQSKLALPAKATNLNQQERQAQAERLRAQVRQQTEAALKNYEKSSFEINGETIDYIWNDAEKTGVVEKVVNADKPAALSYMDEAGNVDAAKMYEDFHFLQNRDKIVASVAQKLASKMLDDLLKKIKNRSNDDKGGSGKQKDTGESITDRANRILKLNY